MRIAPPCSPTPLRRGSPRGAWRALVLASAAFLLAACAGGGDTAPSTAPEPPITQAPPTPGILGITVVGLPVGASADVQVTSVAATGFSRTAIGNVAWTDVPAGRYTITVRPVRAVTGSFAGAPTTLSVDVAAAAAALATVTYAPVPSALALDITGLPGGATPLVTLTAPGVPPAAVAQSGVFPAPTQRGPGVGPESWRVTAEDVSSGGTRYRPTPAATDVSVLFGDTARVTVRYAIGSGAIAVLVGGLPTSLAGNLTLLGPSDFRRSITGTTTITGLAAGRYRLAADAVTQNGITYRPSSDTLELEVTLSLVATPAAITYIPQLGQLALSISGVPAGLAPAIQLTGPGISRALTTSATLDSLPSGSYTLTAAPLVADNERFAPTPASQTIRIATGVLATAAVAYAAVPTTVEVDVSGLPVGTNAGLLLTAPNGNATSLSGSVRIAPAAAGRWRLSAQPVNTATAIFAPALASFDQTVAPGGALVFPVRYAVSTGSLTVTLAGLPSGATGAVTVTGPGNQVIPVTSTSTLTSLAPGSYTVTAANVSSAGSSYRPTTSTQTVVVAASLTPAAATVTYEIASGALAVVVSGLPGTAAGQLTITGPNAFSRTVTATSTLTGLVPGVYTISAQRVVIGGNDWVGAPASQSVTVNASLVATPATVTYTLGAGALNITVNGVPSGASAAVTVTGPGGFSRALTGSTALTALVPGSYTIAAAAVSSGGNSFVPTPVSQSLTVNASSTSASATVTYAQSTGSLQVVMAGLPGGANGSVQITGPNGYTQALTASQTLNGLVPGSYTVTAATVNVSGVNWLASPPSQSVTVSASSTAAAAVVTYGVSAGTLALNVTGLPGGANAAITVTGPNAFTRSVTASTTLTALPPGTYTVAAAAVTNAGTSFVATPSTQTVTVNASATANATVAYTQSTGLLAIAITGLPSGGAGNVTITGPGGFSRTLSATQTLTGLVPGTYAVAATSVVVTGQTWSASPPQQNVTVTASPVAAAATVVYVQNPGALTLTVTGMPGGNPASITVSGPNGYSQGVTASTTLSNLGAGSYTISAANVLVGANRYNPSVAVQSVTINSGATSTASVAYSISTGSLALTVNGVPGGASGAVSVTGPGGFSRSVTASSTLSTLAPGSYTVTAATISSGGSSYVPTPTSQTVTVNASTSAATATVTYAISGGGGGGGGGGVNYTLNNVYLTQAIQKPDNSVRLVANRDALLRAFVVANGANSATPAVRVRIYDGPTLLQTTTLNAPESSVRTTTAEGTLTSTWNTIIPAANVRPAMRVLVDLDPTLAVPDADRADNSWPLNGTPATIAVSSVPTFTVRFVPVTVGALTGNVTTGNRESFLATTRRIWPLQNVASDVRAPFTSSATQLQSNDGNGDWLTVLSEMNTLRAADGAPPAMHYYGVVKVSYGSGIAGYGYVPGRSAIGWDYLPSGDNVAAHEWGHNFSRSHAPCGTSGDPMYPYAGGIINFWGWNSSTNALVAPSATDVMSYCGNTWISDYNWSAVMTYRASSGAVASALTSGATSRDGLLVWGRVVDGAIQLEPAFRVEAPSTPAASRPTHRLDLLDDAGAALLQLPIEASLVDHVTDREERQFAVVVPWSAALEDRLASIRVADPRAPLRSVARRTPFASPAAARAAGAQMLRADVEPTETLARTAGGRLRVSWRNGGYGMAMVRDASTGEIMGYVRRPGAEVATGGRRVEVVFSDGVRSVVR
jgi:hypothetical protein